MSIMALKWAFERETDPSAKFVLVALANFADEQGYCYPKQATLSKMTAQNVRTVRRALVSLEAGGFIRRAERWTKKGNRRADCYWLVMSDEPPEEFIPYLSPPDDPSVTPPPGEVENEDLKQSYKRSQSPVISGHRVRLYKRSQSPVIKSINRHSFFEPSLFDPPPDTS